MSWSEHQNSSVVIGMVIKSRLGFARIRARSAEAIGAIEILLINWLFDF